MAQFQGGPDGNVRRIPPPSSRPEYSTSRPDVAAIINNEKRVIRGIWPDPIMDPVLVDRGGLLYKLYWGLNSGRIVAVALLGAAAAWGYIHTRRVHERADYRTAIKSQEEKEMTRRLTHPIYWSYPIPLIWREPEYLHAQRFYGPRSPIESSKKVTNLEADWSSIPSSAALEHKGALQSFVSELPHVPPATLHQLHHLGAEHSHTHHVQLHQESMKEQNSPIFSPLGVSYRQFLQQIRDKHSRPITKAAVPSLPTSPIATGNIPQSVISAPAHPLSPKPLEPQTRSAPEAD